MHKRIGMGTGVSVGAILAVPAAAAADDFKVTNLNSSGAGSLRQAAEDANADDGADRILFNSKLSGTIELGGDDIGLYGGDIEVLGPGARRVTVDGEGADRVFSFSGDYYPTLSPASVATLAGLTVTGGDAYVGGGVGGFGADLDLTISRTTISGNTAESDGAGVHIRSEPSNSLTIDSSTISGNSAGTGNDDNGGGVFSYVADVTIRSSTISGNSAGGAGGGAMVYNDFGSGAPGSFEVRNSTVTGNEAEYGGGLSDLYAYDHELHGVIVAGNDDSLGNPDLDEGPWVASFSIIGDPATATVVNDGGNLLGVDPLLKPLANNGGPTDTHAIKKSPAKNAGPSDAPDKDQRGAPRKGQPDIGAYELTKCKGVIVNRVGTSGKDKLKGTKRKDGILGLGGNDKLKGKKGKDGLCGGRGKDKLIGGPGKDKFNGGPGKDKEIQ